MSRRGRPNEEGIPEIFVLLRHEDSGPLGEGSNESDEEERSVGVRGGLVEGSGNKFSSGPGKETHREREREREGKGNSLCPSIRNGGAHADESHENFSRLEREESNESHGRRQIPSSQRILEETTVPIPFLPTLRIRNVEVGKEEDAQERREMVGGELSLGLGGDDSSSISA